MLGGRRARTRFGLLARAGFVSVFVVCMESCYDLLSGYRTATRPRPQAHRLTKSAAFANPTSLSPARSKLDARWVAERDKKINRHRSTRSHTQPYDAEGAQGCERNKSVSGLSRVVVKRERRVAGGKQLSSCRCVARARRSDDKQQKQKWQFLAPSAKQQQRWAAQENAKHR